MKRPHAACRLISGFLAAVTAATTMPPMQAIASTSAANFDMREQVVKLTGIMDVTNYTQEVTRGEFARMLVKASSYRENLPVSNVSVFADVPSIHPNAVYIRLAASQGWMTAYLGGMFKPDDPVTFKDAVKAFLTILGYTDGDFSGDLSSSRISKFNYLELNEKMSLQSEDSLNQKDCMNLFYNLLKAKKKDSSEIYGAVLKCELNSDGEINPISILDDERKGPVLIHKGFSVIESVPFSSDGANVFLNGSASTLAVVKASQKTAGFVVIYYNVKSKTIWAYTTQGWDDDDDNSGNNSYALIKGNIRNIYYKSTDVMTPTSVRMEVDESNSDEDFTSDNVDSDGCITISLDSTALQYMFSIYGSIEVGDEVVMVCDRSGSSYTAVDAIEY